MLSKLRSSLVRTLALLALAASPSLFAQTTLHVGPGQPYATIQSGIDAANTGDTVLVAPGTYYENIDFKGKAITVTSSGGPSGSPANTIIDGSKGHNPAVVFRNNEGSNSILNGFTIQGGGFDGSPQPPDNYGTAGILITGGTPIVSNNILTHNFCNAIESNGSPLIENNEIDNTIDPHQGCGFAGGSAIWLFGSLRSYNGGNDVTSPPAMVVGNLIQNNTQSGRDDAGGNGGTGVAVWGAVAEIIGNTIRNNVTFGDGGAILSFNTDSVTVIGNLIYGNQAATDGAISMQPPGQSVGPFIGIVASNTVYGNTQTSQAGGAFGDTPPTQVYLDGNLAQYLLTNNIIVGSGPNAVAVACGPDYSYLSVTPLVFDHNDIYNADGAAYGGTCTDQTGNYGNISADPKFSNSSANNYQLLSGSPAIDAGNNSAPQLQSTDLIGSPRIQDTTNLGYPVVDMGAYEYIGKQDAAPTILTLTPSEYFNLDGGSTIFFNPPPLTFTIALTSAAGTPSGPVTVYEDKKTLATVTVDSSGTFVYTPTKLTPGLHAFIATYPGSGAFPPAVSVKFYLLIPTISTTLNLTSSINPSQLGQPVTFTITAAAADNSIPTPITLTDTTTNTLLATLTPNSSGVATYTTSTLSLGTHYLGAVYAGTSTYNRAAFYRSQDVVNGSATTTTLTCNPSTISLGGTSLLSVAVTSATGTPTGSITLTDGSITLGQPSLLNGDISLTYTGSTAGTHSLIAVYVPTGSFAASTASCPIIVNGLPTITTVAVTPNPSTYGQPVVFSTHVAPVAPNKSVPTGKVRFTYCRGATIDVALDANGNGSVIQPTGTEIAEPVGSCSFTGQYYGDSTFAPSTSAPDAYIVTPSPSATTILSSSPNPAYLTQPVTLTVQITGHPSPTANPVTGNPLPPGALQFSGNVQLFDGSVPIVFRLYTSGQSIFTLTTLSVGSHTITAAYSNDPNLGSSTSAPVTEVILPAPPADFSLTGDPTTFRTGQTGTGGLMLASIANFTGTVSISCIPPYPTGYICTVQVPTVALTPNLSEAFHYILQPSLTASSTRPPTHSTPRILLASLFPLTLLSLVGLASRRRSPLRTLLSLTLLAILATATTACGPDHFIFATPPGTYPISFTATGTNQGNSTPITHTLTVNVIITP